MCLRIAWGNDLSVSFSSYLSQCTVQNIVKLSKVSSFLRRFLRKFSRQIISHSIDHCLHTSADWVGVWSTRPITKSAQYIVVRSVGSFDEMRQAFASVATLRVVVVVVVVFHHIVWRYIRGAIIFFRIGGS